MGATVNTNKRKIAADDFFKGMYETALADGEIITSVSFPIPKKAAYVKFPQPASRFALVGVFVAQTAGGVRVAVTGAASVGVPREGARGCAGEELHRRRREGGQDRRRRTQQRPARIGRLSRAPRLGAGREGRRRDGLIAVRSLSHLFDNNRAWSERIRRSRSGFLRRACRGSSGREYLWIGCADSRVPANEIVGLLPGELFVHRNIANVVVHTDLNCLSVMQFAVDVLQVEHIIVCGHYGCSGVAPRCRTSASAWPTTGCATCRTCTPSTTHKVAAVADMPQRIDRLCELNVIEQVANVCQTTIVRDAWERGQELAVHGWVYGLHDGLVRDLNTTATQQAEVPPAYRAALAAL